MTVLARWLVVALALALLAPHGVAAAPKEIEATDCMWNPDAQYDGKGDGFGAIDRAAFYALTFPSANMTGAHWRFRGEFPKARYFGFQTYGDYTSPIDALPDSLMRPDAGSVNPYQGKRWRREHVSYTIDMRDVPLAKRRPRSGNTLYGGYYDDGRPTNRNQIEYRIYVPDRSIHGRGIVPGGVPLPRIYYVIDDPATASWHSHDEVCRFNSSGPTFRAIHAGDEAFIALDEPLRTAGGPFAAATNPPSWISSSNKYNRYYPYVNQEAGYLLTFANPAYGEVLALRFKAPTFSPEGRPPTNANQVRYWSVCTIQTANFTYTDACLRDAQTHPDARGFVTIAISDTAHRPVVGGRPYPDWMPYPGGYDMIFVRHVVPNPKTFRDSNYWVQGGIDDGAIRRQMREYYPSGEYCSKTAFEATRCR